MRLSIGSKIAVGLAGLLETESSSRGYSLLPNASFKQLFQASATQTNATFSQLRALTSDNPNQQQRLDRLGVADPSK